MDGGTPPYKLNTFAAGPSRPVTSWHSTLHPPAARCIIRNNKASVDRATLQREQNPSSVSGEGLTDM